MTDSIRWGLDNPHPFSQMKMELIWEGKYDEYGNRRTEDIAGFAMPLQKIETIDEPASRALVQGNLFDPAKAHRDDFRNRLIWGDVLVGYFRTRGSHQLCESFKSIDKIILVGLNYETLVQC